MKNNIFDYDHQITKYLIKVYVKLRKKTGIQIAIQMTIFIEPINDNLQYRLFAICSFDYAQFATLAILPFAIAIIWTILQFEVEHLQFATSRAALQFAILTITTRIRIYLSATTAPPLRLFITAEPTMKRIVANRCGHQWPKCARDQRDKFHTPPSNVSSQAEIYHHQ